MPSPTTYPRPALLDPSKHPTLTVEQAAELLGLSRGAVYEAVRRGSIPVIRLSGRSLRVPTEAFMRDVLQMPPSAAHGTEAGA